MAQAGDDFYVGVREDRLPRRLPAHAGRRRREGRLDLEALDDPALHRRRGGERLLALPGVGPYACAHVMMLLGRYGRLVLDSWTRPKYRTVTGRPRVTDKGIEKAFRRYREYAGLAFLAELHA
jgi:3-methyladenine DNA glycosylase/8-oxoguanine DNA glycosylase